MSDPTVVVVEDDPDWRHELAMMYSRILRGGTIAEGYHASVKTCSTAREAIEYFREKSGDGRATKAKVDILSLDMNLQQRKVGHGLDVLDAACKGGQAFVTIVISECISDDDLHEQMGEGAKLLLELETQVSKRTRARCVFYPKRPALGSTEAQVAAIEKQLNSKVHGNANVLRNWRDELRNTPAQLNGKTLCLHFMCPKEMYGVSGSDYVPAILTPHTRPFLNKLEVWKGCFETIDSQSGPSDLLTRLTYLTTTKRQFLQGISLRSMNELVDTKTGRHSAPLPRGKWLCPRPGVDLLTAREAFLLLQLIFQRQLETMGRAYIPKGALDEVGNIDESSVAGREGFKAADLMVSGLLNGNVLELPGHKRSKPAVKQNGDSLDVLAATDREKNALKQAKKCLNDRLKTILSVDYDLVTARGETYKLELPGIAYLQLDDDA